MYMGGIGDVCICGRMYFLHFPAFYTLAFAYQLQITQKRNLRANHIRKPKRNNKLETQ